MKRIEQNRLLPLKLIAVFLLMAFGVSESLAQEPALPPGLDDGKSQESIQGPSLPPGIGDDIQKQPSQQPDLPPGLVADETPPKEKPPQKKRQYWRLPPDMGGYWEIRGGARIKNDPVQDDASLAEMRLQLTYDKYIAEYIPRGRFRVASDFIFDAIISDHDHVDMEKGEGFIDLREIWLSFTPADFMDVKVGRQILTWGTGNLIFLNDLFPKDYQAFFLGRDVEYLKAPSDSLKVSFYSTVVSVDIAYTPRFDADRFVDGSRLSFYDPALGDLRGEDMPMDPERPDNWFQDDEIAVRGYRNIGAYELAVYGYHGFWKSPAGTDSQTGKRIFPELNALGASIRGPIGPGIANAEFCWYDSRDDPGGNDPYVENSEMRYLVGYEQEIATDLTLGLQYYVNYMLDYNDYKRSLPVGFPARDEDRHWVTLDLTQELMAQNQLVLSLFSFYSLSEDDFYFRPKATFDFTDNWKVQTGANIFLGDRETFFGQFDKNNNVYAALRYSF